jgi:hypothetical protein
VKDEAKEEGIAEDTLLIAKRRVCGFEHAGGGRGRWLWFLREDDADAPTLPTEPIVEKEVALGSLASVG